MMPSRYEHAAPLRLVVVERTCGAAPGIIGTGGGLLFQAPNVLEAFFHMEVKITLGSAKYGHESF